MTLEEFRAISEAMIPVIQQALRPEFHGLRNDMSKMSAEFHAKVEAVQEAHTALKSEIEIQRARVVGWAMGASAVASVVIGVAGWLIEHFVFAK